MPDLPIDAEAEAANASPEEPRPTSGAEDFLFHLYRGSELLVQDRVVEAKEELEQALALQPQDEKGQDLLAGVYFRLGVYPRAIEIWSRLVETHPRDVALRVNLGLALLKTGQPGDAVGHIQTAIELAPEHERAWGYLGLVQWRLGRFEEARESFLRGGQASMARRMEDALSSASGFPGPFSTDGTATAEERGRAAMRSAAEQAIKQIDAEELPLALASGGGAAPRTGGAWSAHEPGSEPVPRRLRLGRVRPAAAPPGLSLCLDAWTVELPDSTPLAVGAAGDLFLQTETEVYCRLEGLRAVRGALRATPLQRRARGQDQGELLGGEKPIMHWRGPVTAVLAPPEGARFYGLSLDSDDVLYVREENLWAFEEGLSFETGRLPLAGAPVVLTQLWGAGSVILGLASPPVGLRVEEGQPVHVEPTRLLGWTGRLFPSGRRGTAPYGAGAPPLSFRGDGVVLVG